MSGGKQTCGTCKYWKEFGSQCRRHSPTTMISTDRNIAIQPVFPTTYENDWCGDWEERDERG